MNLAESVIRLRKMGWDYVRTSKRSGPGFWYDKEGNRAGNHHQAWLIEREKYERNERRRNAAR